MARTSKTATVLNAAQKAWVTRRAKTAAAAAKVRKPRVRKTAAPVAA